MNQDFQTSPFFSPFSRLYRHCRVTHYKRLNRRLHEQLSSESNQFSSTKIPVTLQEGLYIRPFLHRIHQLHQPRVILQPFSPLLRQPLIVADLIEHHIRICNVPPDNVRPRLRQIVRLQMRLQAIQNRRSKRPLMLGISLVFIVGKEGLDEESAP